MQSIQRTWRMLPSALLCLASAAVSAQEVLEEIVVTADYRERLAAKLPASVSILDEETIEASAVQHFEELVFAVPNLNWSGDGHRARYFQIRGVGELEQYEGAPNPSVGFLIDDIDFSGIGAIATLFDVERIEVLRGPQGSRYGANALAGLVYVQSAEATEDWSGKLQLGAGDDGMASAGIAIGGPLVDAGNARFRLSAHHHRSNGFRNNPFLASDDTNGRDETTIRAKLRWDTDNDWSLKLAAIHADIDNGYDAFAIDNSLDMLSDKPGRDAQQSLGASFRADWYGGEQVRFTSLTAYADSDIHFSFDADWGNPDSWLPFTYDFIVDNRRKRRTLSQEFRFASAGNDGDTPAWLAGVYVMRLNDDLTGITEGILVDPDPQFGYTFAVNDRLFSDYEATSSAVFGQVDFPVGESGSIAVGGRVEQRNADYENSAGYLVSPTETMIGGELSYTQQLNDELSAFATLSRGFKAGGFNPGVGIPQSRREFGDETLWNFEVGVRSLWLDRTLSANVSVFWSERRDQQIRTSFQLVPNDPASFVFFTDNAKEGRTTGLEAELAWTPDVAWSLQATIGLLNAKIRRFGTPEVDLDGREQAHAPGYTASIGANYFHPTGWFARANLSARDEFFFDYSHDQKSAAYELVNLAAGFAAERWTVTLRARNVLDEYYAVRGFYFGNEPPAFPNTLYIRQGDPRQVGLTFDMRF